MVEHPATYEEFGCVSNRNIMGSDGIKRAGRIVILFAFYATSDQKTIRIWRRDWCGQIIVCDDGRFCPQSNFSLCFDTTQEPAEAEFGLHQNAVSDTNVDRTVQPEITRKPAGKEGGRDSAKRDGRG